MGNFFDFLGNVATGIGAVFNPLAGLANFGLQLGQQSWQKEMQRRAWNREDTAVQRRAADLQAAGINPLLAAGSAAQSSGPVSISAPQIDPNSFANAAKGVLDLQANRKNIAMADASILKMKEDTERQRLDNLMLRGLLHNAGNDLENNSGMKVDEQGAADWLASYDYMKKQYENNIAGEVWKGAVADAENKRTNADQAARDLAELKNRNLYSWVSPDILSLGDIQKYAKATGAGNLIWQNMLRFFTSSQNQQSGAEIGARAGLKGASAPLVQVIK